MKHIVEFRSTEPSDRNGWCPLEGFTDKPGNSGYDQAMACARWFVTTNAGAMKRVQIIRVEVVETFDC